MSVVEFYQRASRRSVPLLPHGPEVGTAEVPTNEQGGALQLPEVSRLIVESLKDARISQDRAAALMGISPSLLGRQLQNLDNQHVSLHRLCLLPNRFWLPFLVRFVKWRRLARVRQRVELDFELMP